MASSLLKAVRAKAQRDEWGPNLRVVGKLRPACRSDAPQVPSVHFVSGLQLTCCCLSSVLSALSSRTITFYLIPSDLVPSFLFSIDIAMTLAGQSSRWRRIPTFLAPVEMAKSSPTKAAPKQGTISAKVNHWLRTHQFSFLGEKKRAELSFLVTDY